MIKASVNNHPAFTIENGTIDGKPINWDLIKVNETVFHILRNHRSYTATLVNFNKEEKTLLLSINGNEYTVSIKDENDLLLEKLGISGAAAKKINNIKAPMPGLILSINVAVGEEVKKGDTVLILEAMKMENVLKSQGDGKVKKINIALRQTVEKGQVLIEFE